jgi:hypothetical protein
VRIGGRARLYQNAKESLRYLLAKKRKYAPPRSISLQKPWLSSPLKKCHQHTRKKGIIA